MAERDGVYEVIETNRRKFADPQFRNKYISLAKAAINERRLLPTGLCSTQNGADIVAQDILMRLQDRSIKK